MAINLMLEGEKDEGEKPFWISYSDLMTALMVLFLVIMVVSLTSISQEAIRLNGDLARLKQELEEAHHAKVDVAPIPWPRAGEIDPEKLKELERLSEVAQFCQSIEKALEIPGSPARVDCERNVIDLGRAGQFASGEYKLGDAGNRAIQQLAAAMVKVANSPQGKKWLKRVHIQGFTDTDGSYLYNLNLSLRRSEWVMCQILSTEPSEGLGLITPLERTLAKNLFLAGGVAFNDLRNSKEASRRVEFRVEYYSVDEASKKDTSRGLFKSKNDTQERCQI